MRYCYAGNGLGVPIGDRGTAKRGNLKDAIHYSERAHKLKASTRKNTQALHKVPFVACGGYFLFAGMMTTSFSLLRTTSKVKEVGCVAGLNKETGCPSIDWMTSPGCRPASEAAVKGST